MPQMPAKPHGAFGERPKPTSDEVKHPTAERLSQAPPKGQAVPGKISKIQDSPRKEG